MTANAEFVPGRVLSRHLSAIIEPRMRRLFPQVPFALAYMGPGSDVLGYDTARSMDHDWGPRLTIVVPDHARDDVAKGIDAAIDQLLPAAVGGFPTRYARHPDNALYPDPHGRIHRLAVTSAQQLLHAAAGIEFLKELNPAVWLSTPMQLLLEITSGEVFVDNDGQLSTIRAALAFYPDDVWRYQLSALWMRIGQVQPFIGRSGEVGDEAGSATVAASIARNLMRIALLQSRQYAPYAKWLGTAFSRSATGAEMQPHLAQALSANTWQEREAGINRAGTVAIRQLNDLGLISRISPRAAQFHTRPFHVLPAEEIAQALHDSLADTALAKLTPFVGGIDVVTDSTDALKSVPFRAAMRAMFTDRIPT